MSKKYVAYFLFFGALLIAFFAFLSFLLPGFTKPKTVAITTVMPFSFTNQNGEAFTEKNIAGKVAAVNFFFTTCKTVCPKMNNNLMEVYQMYQSNPNFIILSHTSDPQRDSASVLKHYADSLHINTAKWVFLTGRKDSLYTAARHSYRIDDPDNYVQNIDDDFLHTQFIALVNKKGEVVKIYDGIKPSEMKEMEKEIAKLLNE